MRHVRLQAFEDENGNLGLIIKGTPKEEGIFSSSEGGLVAHDLLEHQQGVAKIGCPEDELIALGALWQTRGRWGNFFTKYQWRAPEEDLGMNIASVWRDLTGCDWWPGTKRYRTKTHHQDESFEAMIAYAEKQIRADSASHIEFLESLGRDQDKSIKDFLADTWHLLRIGYRMADRRFGDGYESHDLFRAVKDAVNPCAKHVEYEGQEFILSYGRGKAYCREVYA